MADLIDLTGKRFGRLTVIEKMPPRYKNKTAAFWRCKCDCGRETIVIGRSLRVGLTKSCGCIQSEMMSNKIYYEVFCDDGKNMCLEVYKNYEKVDSECIKIIM